MNEEQMIEECAKAAHEVNKAYCEFTGDDSQVSWEDAPDWQKESARMGAKAALNPEQRPEDSHESWMAQKVADGWVYGEVKDPEAKTHHCMVPYNQLPAEQRAKDHLFLAVVRQTKALIDEVYDSVPG